MRLAMDVSVVPFSALFMVVRPYPNVLCIFIFIPDDTNIVCKPVLLILWFFMLRVTFVSDANMVIKFEKTYLYIQNFKVFFVIFFKCLIFNL